MQKNREKIKRGIELKTQKVNENDVDSIVDEHIQFYSMLFTTEGWDENSANKLTQHIESKLNGDEKETLDLVEIYSVYAEKIISDGFSYNENV